MEDFQVLFGLTVFCARVLRVPMAQFYHIVKFMRRRLAQTDPHSTQFTMAKVWPSIVPRWKGLVRNMLNNPWTRHLPTTENSELVLFTDASLTGWGGILFDEATGEVRQSCGRWSSPQQSKSVNELELRALRHSMDAFVDHMGSHPLLIVLDNSPDVSVLSRGTSHAFRLCCTG